jgi:hypothetical protein
LSNQKISNIQDIIDEESPKGNFRKSPQRSPWKSLQCQYEDFNFHYVGSVDTSYTENIDTPTQMSPLRNGDGSGEKPLRPLLKKKSLKQLKFKLECSPGKVEALEHEQAETHNIRISQIQAKDFMTTNDVTLILEVNKDQIVSKQEIAHITKNFSHSNPSDRNIHPPPKPSSFENLNFAYERTQSLPQKPKSKSKSPTPQTPPPAPLRPSLLALTPPKNAQKLSKIPKIEKKKIFNTKIPYCSPNSPTLDPDYDSQKSGSPDTHDLVSNSSSAEAETLEWANRKTSTDKVFPCIGSSRLSLATVDDRFLVDQKEKDWCGGFADQPEVCIIDNDLFGETKNVLEKRRSRATSEGSSRRVSRKDSILVKNGKSKDFGFFDTGVVGGGGVGGRKYSEEDLVDLLKRSEGGSSRKSLRFSAIEDENILQSAN